VISPCVDSTSRCFITAAATPRETGAPVVTENLLAAFRESAQHYCAASELGECANVRVGRSLFLKLTPIRLVFSRTERRVKPP